MAPLFNRLFGELRAELQDDRRILDAPLLELLQELECSSPGRARLEVWPYVAQHMAQLHPKLTASSLLARFAASGPCLIEPDTLCGVHIRSRLRAVLPHRITSEICANLHALDCVVAVPIARFPDFEVLMDTRILTPDEFISFAYLDSVIQPKQVEIILHARQASEPESY
ncbi:MAG: hypothetical protein AAGI01_00675 [Myxococcota bacterium]